MPSTEVQLARFVCDTDRGLDPVLAAKAVRCLIDGVGASMTLSRSEEGRQALASVGGHDAGSASDAGTSRSHGATVLGTGLRQSCLDAVFVNAVVAAATIRTDTHAASASHPGMVVLPVLLALAESKPDAISADGSDLLAAMVVGYEVSIRLGLALVSPELARRFRPTGLTGAVGAAAAACRLLRLDMETTRHAIALAANTASGLNEWARAGTSEHVFHAGTAARNALTSVGLARANVVAAPLSLSGEGGLLAAYGASDRLPWLVEGLGTHFHMHDVIHKLAPACVFAQAPCQAALGLLRGDALDTGAIESIEIGVAHAAAVFPGCDFAGPFDTPSSAQQSIQFGVASVLHAGRIDEALWAKPQIEGIARIAKRCRLVADDAIEAAYPARAGASLKLKLRGRGERIARVGDAAPMSASQIDSRFLLDASDRLGQQTSAKLLTALRDLSTPGAAGLDEVIRLLAAAPQESLDMPSYRNFAER